MYGMQIKFEIMAAKNKMAKNVVTVIAEGGFDARVLDVLLHKVNLPGTDFNVLESTGYSSALSTANTLLSLNYDKVILVLDSDSVSEADIEERKDFVDSYINGKFYRDRIKTVWAVPSFEIIFFQNKLLLEQILNKNIADDFWELGKSSPKKALELITGQKREFLLELLKNKMLKDEMLKSSLIVEMLDFAKSTMQQLLVA